MAASENVSTLVFLFALAKAKEESNEKIRQLKEYIDSIPVYTNIKGKDVK